MYLIALLSLMSFAVTVPVKAADFSYNYGQVSYDDIDIDLGVFSVGGDGFSFGGSFEINPNMFIEANYGTWDLDFGVDATGYAFGVGYHMPLNQKTDMVFGLSFGNVELEGPGGSVDSDSLSISAGVRHQLHNNIELDAEIAYVDPDEGDSDFAFSLGALYAFSKNISAGVELGFADDVDTLSIGARFYF